MIGSPLPSVRRDGSALRPPRRAARTGFTLVEMLVVVVLFAVVVTAIGQVAAGQAKFYVRNGGSVSAANASNAGAQSLLDEVRDISPGDGDLVQADSQTLKIRRTKGVGYICRGRQFVMPIVLLKTVTGSIQANDSVQVFLEGDSTVVTDDAYTRSKLTSLGLSATCPDGSGAGNTPVFTTILGTQLVTGAMVRAFEVVTYDLYTLNSKQYLTRVDQAGNRTYIAGPLRTPNALFVYYDSLGVAVVGQPAKTAGIAVTLPGGAGNMLTTVPTINGIRVQEPWFIALRGRSSPQARGSKSGPFSLGWWTTARAK